MFSPFHLPSPSVLVEPRVVVALLLISAFLVYLLYLRPYHLSSIKDIPGPPSDSIITGNLQDIFKSEAAAKHQIWTGRYGPTIMYRGFMGGNRLYTTDPKVLLHILIQKPYDYPKPAQARHMLAQILGKGILFVEGDQHKRQRRILNGPFTQAQVNSYLPIFQSQAEKLAQRIKVDAESKGTKQEDKVEHGVVNVYNWLSRATLDVIGLAGFDYEFGALDDDNNELASVFADMLQPRKINLRRILVGLSMRYVPAIGNIPIGGVKRIIRAREVMAKESNKMMQQRREMAQAGELEGKKDLLSLIVKANMETTNPKERLMDEELMGQISTFMLAGHETSSVALSWILHHLSLKLGIQQKLRDEILDAQTAAAARGQGALAAEDFAGLRYLDAVVRESLRFHPPVYMTSREASKDDVIPLGEPMTGRNGQAMTSLRIEKGQTIMIGIYTLNRSTAVFGEDADEYRPERWLDGSVDNAFDKARGLTAWAPLLTFLGGPRGCVGYRFALLEIKVLLAELVSKFEFLERDKEGTPMTCRSNIVTRPVVVGEEEKGGQLPLRVRVL